jgi:hypothetical protein
MNGRSAVHLLTIGLVLQFLACSSQEEPSILWIGGTGVEPRCEPTLAEFVQSRPVSTVPVIRNPSAVLAALASLDDGGPGFRVQPWVLVDSLGVATHLAVDELGSSGDLAQDTLLLSIAPLLDFRPATLNGRPACLWIRLPFRVP